MSSSNDEYKASVRCGLCEKRIWSPWNPDPSGWCGTKAPHPTCKCSLDHFFLLNTSKENFTMCPAKPKDQAEQFMDRFCCVQGAAVTLLPLRARKDIVEAMSGRECGSCLLALSNDAKGMRACNSACCPGYSTECNFTLLKLMDKYSHELVAISPEQEDALKLLITQNNVVKDYYTSQELFDWDMHDDTTKPQRNRRGLRPLTRSNPN
jgi:hypothetical protein